MVCHCVGRLKELIITAGGENIAPVPIEQSVKLALPELISNCMVVGDTRKFLAILITLKTQVNLDTLMPTEKLTDDASAFLRNECHITHTIDTVEDFLSAPTDVKQTLDALIHAGLEKANAQAVSRAAKVQYFLVLPRDFSLPGGELGPTLKLRRGIVAKMYKEEIDALYSRAEASSQLQNQ